MGSVVATDKSQTNNSQMSKAQQNTLTNRDDAGTTGQLIEELEEEDQ